MRFSGDKQMVSNSLKIKINKLGIIQKELRQLCSDFKFIFSELLSSSTDSRFVVIIVHQCRQKLARLLQKATNFFCICILTFPPIRCRKSRDPIVIKEGPISPRPESQNNRLKAIYIMWMMLVNTLDNRWVNHLT